MPGRDPRTLAGFPTGTTSSFDIRFEGAAIEPASLLGGAQLSSVSGTLPIGDADWTITAGRIDAGSFYTLEILLDADLLPTSRGIPPIVAALSYPLPSGFQSVGAVELAGDFRAASVPEPATGWLLMLPLAWMGSRRGRRGGA